MYNIILKAKQSDGKGWVGDLKKMLLDVSKLKNLDWNPRLSSMEAVSIATKDLLEGIKGSI
jgi:UDP-glucose 4-epimerase